MKAKTRSVVCIWQMTLVILGWCLGMHLPTETASLAYTGKTQPDCFSCTLPTPIKWLFLGRFISTQPLFLFPLSSLSFHQRSSSAVFFLSWSNLLFHSEPSLHSSFFYLSLIEVSGGSREVTGVCLLGPSVCLSNEPETQGVSLLWRWGDRGRPKGDKPC